MPEDQVTEGIDGLKPVNEWTTVQAGKSEVLLKAIKTTTSRRVPRPGGAIQRARPGDWIIRNAAGEFYACSPTTFEALYEVLDG